MVSTDEDSNVVANIAFSGFENLTGNLGDDTFVFADGMGVAGRVDGGGGSNTLN